jgi:hypothetical protein
MADLHAQLREIETATPPDLWAGIVARAEKEGPKMDGTNVVAFRKDGSEWRRRAATALIAAAVFVVGFVVVWRAFQPAPTVIPPGTQTLPTGWVLCTNDVVGYSIGYPGDWHTTDVFEGEADPANACMWFSPEPFGPDGNLVPEGYGYPLEVLVRGEFDAERADVVGEAGQIIEQDFLQVEGRRAVRIEHVPLLEPLADGPRRHYEYLIELDPETILVVHTTEIGDLAGGFEENKAIVDDAVDTLRFQDAPPSS